MNNFKLPAVSEDGPTQSCSEGNHQINEILEEAAMAVYATLTSRANMTQITQIEKACKAIRARKRVVHV